MNCLEFRRAVGADPRDVREELQEHRRSCAACDQYAREMLKLDGLIKRALEVPVPPIRDVTKLAPRPEPRARWYAMAASVIVAIGAAALWVFSYPRDTLANDVVAHMTHEPQAMQPSEARVSAQLLDGALRAKGLHLAQPMNDVSYLQSCVIRGHVAPHLVVQTKRGPVTVLLLTDEPLRSAKRFDEHQYHGVLEPTPHGALAVIALDPALVDEVATKVNAAIAWE